MADRRKFSPIFTASVTPTASVAYATTAKGVPYAKFPATVGFKGGDAQRTVMAFGDQLAAVRKSLRKGRAVELAIQHDNGTVKVIGLPRENVAA